MGAKDGIARNIAEIRQKFGISPHEKIVVRFHDVVRQRLGDDEIRAALVEFNAELSSRPCRQPTPMCFMLSDQEPHLRDRLLFQSLDNHFKE